MIRFFPGGVTRDYSKNFLRPQNKISSNIIKPIVGIVAAVQGERNKFSIDLFPAV